MDAKRSGWLRSWGFVLALALALCLAACGGEEGVGSGGSGVTVGFGEGTVTTLGNSIAIDGTGFDTTKASVQTEASPGTFTPAAVKLGQHIEFNFKVDRVADAIRVEPQAVGSVDALGAGIFTVLGQRVRINSDPRVGPVTVFDGYSGLADVRVGDVVEVHGLSRRDATGVYILQATRVEKLAVRPQYQRLAGVVTLLNVNAQFTSFRLGDVLVVVPAGTQVAADVARLVNGLTVSVFGQLVAGQFNAGFVSIKNRQNSGIDAYFGGTLTQIAGTASNFELNGVPVRFGSVSIDDYEPADQQYIQVRGNFAIDGSLDVTSVILRGSSEDDTETEIEGFITGYDPSSFTALVTASVPTSNLVRDVVVRMRGARAQDCGRGLGVGVYVEVRGQVVGGGVVADRVRCFYELFNDKPRKG